MNQRGNQPQSRPGCPLKRRTTLPQRELWGGTDLFQRNQIGNGGGKRSKSRSRTERWLYLQRLSKMSQPTGQQNSRTPAWPEFVAYRNPSKESPLNNSRAARDSLNATGYVPLS